MVSINTLSYFITQEECDNPRIGEANEVLIEMIMTYSQFILYIWFSLVYEGTISQLLPVIFI